MNVHLLELIPKMTVAESCKYPGQIIKDVVIRLSSFSEVVHFTPFAFPFPDLYLQRKAELFQKVRVDMLAKVFGTRKLY